MPMPSSGARSGFAHSRARGRGAGVSSHRSEQSFSGLRWTESDRWRAADQALRGSRAAPCPSAGKLSVGVKEGGLSFMTVKNHQKADFRDCTRPVSLSLLSLENTDSQFSPCICIGQTCPMDPNGLVLASGCFWRVLPFEDKPDAVHKPGSPAKNEESHWNT